MNIQEILTCFFRLAFSILAFSASCASLITEREAYSPSPYGDGAGGLWVLASILYLASVAFEFAVLSDKMTKTFGGYTINSIGAILLVLASIMYFVDRMEGGPKDLVAGFTLTAGLFTFVAQFIIAFQLKLSTLSDRTVFLVATALGALASFMYFLGGIFALQHVVRHTFENQYDISSFEDGNDDFAELLTKIWDRFPACMIAGSLFYFAHSVVLVMAFVKKDREATGREDAPQQWSEYVSQCFT